MLQELPKTMRGRVWSAFCIWGLIIFLTIPRLTSPIVSLMKALLTIILLVLPFQAVGAIAYFWLAKNDQRRARTAAAVLPAASFFILFLGLFGWNYFKPGILMLGDGAINLFVLIFGIAGTVLQLAIGAILSSVLYRRKSAGGR